MNNQNPMAEIDAMREIATALEDLSPDARARVLRWAAEHFSSSGQRHTLGDEVSSFSTDNLGSKDAASYESAADLLAATQADSEADKALVMGYWFQVIQGQSDIESQAINTELKHQGHGLSNVTRAFDSLMSQKPQPVIQIRKSGSSKQARKRYKLTTNGIQRVRKMLESCNDGVGE